LTGVYERLDATVRGARAVLVAEHFAEWLSRSLGFALEETKRRLMKILGYNSVCTTDIRPA
jgi:hypothetical protein